MGTGMRFHYLCITVLGSDDGYGFMKVANSLESSMLVAIIQAILSRPPKVLRFCIATLEVQQLAD